MKRAAFTLIEILIAVAILSIMMIFLYKAYASSNKMNEIYGKEVSSIKEQQMKKRVLFLDLSLMLFNSLKIVNQDRESDMLFFASSNSLHDRINPYIAYIVKDKKLYRLESLSRFTEYPLSSDLLFDVDYMGEIETFRLYPSKNQGQNGIFYLLDARFAKEKILLKIKALNEY